MKALCFEQFGGPEVLRYLDIPQPEVREGQVRVALQAIGLNYADVYRRKGNYHLLGNPPYIAGYEGAGIVEQVGPGVTDFKAGDRVGFADVPYANAQMVVASQEHLIPLPDDISFHTAASILLQGLTAQYLCMDSFKVSAGHDVLIHAAAGGVGSLLTQMVSILGGRVIGLTSSAVKREAVLQNGADAAGLYGDNWVAEAKAFSKDGEGVHVAYDSVGSTLQDSFEATRDKGTVVFYGMAGGDPEPVDPRMLMDTSKTLTGGDLWSYLTTAEERIRRAHLLFDWIRSGQLKLAEPAVYALENGADAHRFLESRASTGKIILIP
ncbi:alcohol dehydrogenase [Paenibacillus swuensis]|uniref:Alcohol dehydrogenase n=1 Tax=Paenibacillus swuensis TaxID=1178515 RepID=A0A172TKM9_9BACL|nr:quinone oxidoreductase [Paenibacillus swuensis]ANE47619.1 alcohol dehydrogenase [Paenibacillus swuensis]